MLSICHKWFWMVLVFLMTGYIPAYAQSETQPAYPDLLREPPPPDIPDTGQLYVEFFKMIFMLAAVITFLLLTMWFIKRMMNARIEQMNVSSSIKVTERRLLTPKTAIYVIEVDNRRLVIAESSNGVTSLGSVTSKPEHGN